jgi:hypothetical protein
MRTRNISKNGIFITRERNGYNKQDVTPRGPGTHIRATKGPHVHSPTHNNNVLYYIRYRTFWKYIHVLSDN